MEFNRRLWEVLVDLRNENIRKELGIANGLTYKELMRLPRLKATHESLCAICASDIVIGSEELRLPCAHQFHADCAFWWVGVRPVCPLCKQTISIPSS